MRPASNPLSTGQGATAYTQRSRSNVTTNKPYLTPPKVSISSQEFITEKVNLEDGSTMTWKYKMGKFLGKVSHLR